MSIRPFGRSSIAAVAAGALVVGVAVPASAGTAVACTSGWTVAVQVPNVTWTTTEGCEEFPVDVAVSGWGADRWLIDLSVRHAMAGAESDWMFDYGYSTLPSTVDGDWVTEMQLCPFDSPPGTYVVDGTAEYGYDFDYTDYGRPGTPSAPLTTSFTLSKMSAQSSLDEVVVRDGIARISGRATANSPKLGTVGIDFATVSIQQLRNGAWQELDYTYTDTLGYFSEDVWVGSLQPMRVVVEETDKVLGSTSNSVTPVTPAAPPSAPRGVTATPGNASASVSWNPPAADGGSAVTGYTVRSLPGGQTCSTTGGTSCTVRGLANGTSYSFSVVARNAAGTGSAAWSTSVVPRIPVSVSAVKSGYGNKLAVNVDPDKGAGSYSFRVQKQTSTGSWSTLSTSYMTDGAAETRTVTLGAGVFRVYVPAVGAFGAAYSAPVRLTAPTVKVAVGTDAARDKLMVDVNPNKGSGYWTFRVQKRTSTGWKTLSTAYRTEGRKETKTLNLRRGTYRVKVDAKYNYRGATSSAVTLTR